MCGFLLCFAPKKNKNYKRVKPVFITFVATQFLV